MTINMKPEKFQELCRKAMISGYYLKVIEHAYQRTVSLICTRSTLSKDKPPEGGSGICVEYRDKYYIVTAKHIMKDFQKRNIQIVHQISGEEDEFKRVYIDNFVKETDIDLCFIQLKPGSEETTKKAFISENDFCDPSYFKDDVVLLTGYPGELGELNKYYPSDNGVLLNYNAKRLPYFTYIHNTQQHKITVDYGRWASNDLDSINFKLPNPKGMSGGGLWATGANFDQGRVEDDVKFIGLIVEYSNNYRYIFCISANTILNILKQRFG